VQGVLDGPEVLGVITLQGMLDGRDGQLAPMPLVNRTNPKAIPVSIIV